MEFTFSNSTVFDLKIISLDSMMNEFKIFQSELMAEFFQSTLVSYADNLMSMKTKPFHCEKCSNQNYFT